MGSSLSWLAVKGEEEMAMLSLLEATPDPSAGQLSFTLTRATNGMMYLFEARGRNWSFGIDSKERARLSLGR